MRSLIVISLLLYSLSSAGQFYVSPATDVGFGNAIEVTVLDMDFENEGSVDHSGDLEIRGNYINNGTINVSSINPSRIGLSLNWTNNSTFNSGIGLVEFWGGDQSIDGSSPTYFYDLTHLGAVGITKSLLTDGGVNNQLDIGNVQFDLDNQSLSLADIGLAIARVDGFISTSFNGRLITNSTTPVVGNRELPLGYLAGASTVYKPIHLVNPASSVNYFTLIGEDPANYGMGSLSLQDSLCEVADDYFYRIETTSSDLQFAVELDPSETDYTKLSRWNGTEWIKWSNSGPQAAIPTINLGMNSQNPSNAHFISLAKEQPFVDAGPDITLDDFGISIPIDAEAYLPNGGSLMWTPFEDLSCVDCLKPIYTSGLGGEYILTADNGAGCVDSDTVLIFVNSDVVWIPNAFTPNKTDDLNKNFGPYLFPNERIITLRIYNRWGEKLYEGIEPWDGSYKGEIVPPGVYTYIIEVERPTATFVKQLHREGTVHVLY